MAERSRARDERRRPIHTNRGVRRGVPPRVHLSLVSRSFRRLFSKPSLLPSRRDPSVDICLSSPPRRIRVPPAPAGSLPSERFAASERSAAAESVRHAPERRVRVLREPEPGESAPVESPGGELGDVRRAVRVEPSAPRRRRAREEDAPGTGRARRTARRVRPRRKKPTAAGVVVIRYRPDSSRSHRVSPPVALLLSSRGRGAPSRVSREGREEFLARVGDERVGVGQRGRRVRDRSPVLC